MKTRDTFYYDNNLGQLVWTKSRKIVGWVNRSGHRRMRLNGKYVMVHRFIWEMFNGPIPNGFEIDHINNNPDDNHIANLRLATRSQNMCNQKIQNRKILPKGIDVDKRRNELFRARVKINGFTFSKFFKDLNEAEAWLKSQRESLHKEFTRHK
jgi:hypothetical protein